MCLQALFRDGYKCVLTGFCNKVTLMKVPELNAKSVAENVPSIKTQVAHLFSESAQSNAEYAASAMAILKIFGLDSVVERLLGKRVNNLWNIMTMCVNLHKDFDQFLFWFEAVPREVPFSVLLHCDQFSWSYCRNTLTMLLLFSINPQALRDCADKDNPSHLLKLPDQQLMAMRAACARVAAMSGAADQLRLIMEDRDDAQTLADSDTTIYLVDSILRTLPVGA
ncbi:hypothetical protein B0H14DRAFT_2363457 [Mycena olivaceomarginata]|nr:hypothetical protein B0H14DRAFT_2363457 [Mycena olivaceomarginata]